MPGEDVSERVACEIVLVRYVPDPIRGEFVNIGVILRESSRPEGAQVRFTTDWRRVRCMDASADIETLEGLEAEIRRVLESDDQAALKKINESFSQQVQLSEPKACLSESLPAEMEQAMRLYVNTRKLERGVRHSGRMAIHARMRAEFEKAGVWDLLRKRIPAAAYTRAGDPLRIDCGYRNGKVRMFHAVSLEGESELAKVLAFSAAELMDGVERTEKAELELTAIVQPWSKGDEDADRLAQYRFAVETMEAQKIRVLTTGQLPDVADVARRELRV
jgi:Protein of unknown function (DUF3037)